MLAFTRSSRKQKARRKLEVLLVFVNLTVTNEQTNTDKDPKKPPQKAYFGLIGIARRNQPDNLLDPWFRLESSDLQSAIILTPKEVIPIGHDKNDSNALWPKICRNIDLFHNTRVSHDTIPTR